MADRLLAPRLSPREAAGYLQIELVPIPPLDQFKAACPPLMPEPVPVPEFNYAHHVSAEAAITNTSMAQYFKVVRLNHGGIALTDDYAGSHYYSRQRMLVAAYAAIGPGELAGLSVLDIGCSSGYYSFFAARAGAAEAIGIDARPEHEEQFRLVKAMLGSRAVYQNVDMENELGTLDRRFDIVLAQGVLYHVYDHARFLKHMRRMTGRALILEGEFSGRLDDGCIAHMEPPDNLRSSIHGPVIFPSLGWTARLLRWAGFDRLAYVPLPPGVRDGWGFNRLRRAMLIAWPESESA